MSGVSSIRGPRDAPKVRVFLESRYRKLERGLPQTIFYCPECKGHRRRCKDCARCGGRGRLSDDSVQQLIARKVLPMYRAKLGKFHGAGREDVDVLMLGRGRPFVYEVVAPRNPDVDLEHLRARIHAGSAGRIELEPLRVVSRERIAYWKEARFDKVYRARVRLAGAPAVAPASLVGRTFEILQRTPQRVAHRRADLERERQVTVQDVAEVDRDVVDVELRCAHGTYVKEWVNGDAGRTEPSLASLLDAPSTCAQLDVLEILDLGDGASGDGALGDGAGS